MEDILVPIFICVVLPVSVVLISALTKMNSDNKRTSIIIKAIEANKDIDTEKLVESMRQPKKTARELRSTRLLRGCIYTFIGIALEVTAAVFLLGGGRIDSDAITVPSLAGGISLAIGISYLIVYRMTRGDVEAADKEKSMKKE